LGEDERSCGAAQRRLPRVAHNAAAPRNEKPRNEKPRNEKPRNEKPRNEKPRNENMFFVARSYRAALFKVIQRNNLAFAKGALG
jgi:hypothetical protein